MLYRHHGDLIKKFKAQNRFFWYHIVMILIFTVIYHITAKKYGTEKDKVSLKSWEDCLYYTCTTHFTVGLGDIAPKSDVLRGFTIIHVIGAFLLMNV